MATKYGNKRGCQPAETFLEASGSDSTKTYGISLKHEVFIIKWEQIFTVPPVFTKDHSTARSDTLILHSWIIQCVKIQQVQICVGRLTANLKGAIFLLKCWILTDVLRVNDVEKLGSDNEGTQLYRQRSRNQLSKNFSDTSIAIFGTAKIHRGWSLANTSRDLHMSTSEVLRPAPLFLQSFFLWFFFYINGFKIRTVFSHLNSYPVWNYCKAQF